MDDVTQAGTTFDFLADLPPYTENPDQVARLNARQRFIVQRHADDIRGARVLDLASHDGRWPFAFAEAGAASVLGIEGRAELIARFASFPDTDFKSRVTLRQDDIFAAVEAEVAAGQTYDVVGVLGIFYHIMDHQRMLDLLRRLQPRLVIVDSEFFLRPGPLIRLQDERVDHDHNAIANAHGRPKRTVGMPTKRAMEMMAANAGFDLAWIDLDSTPQDLRIGIEDYFTPPEERPHFLRATCTLRPTKA